MSLHVDEGVNEDFAEWTQNMYGSIKNVKVNHGKVHDFLGMTLDFSEEGICRVKQDDHVNDMIELWPEKFKNTDCVLTPASLDLFDKGGGGLLNNKERKLFHSVIAKGTTLDVDLGLIFCQQSAHCQVG